MGGAISVPNSIQKPYLCMAIFGMILHSSNRWFDIPKKSFYALR
jgi:hypothetical protein